MCIVDQLPLAHYVAYNQQHLLALILEVRDNPDGGQVADLVLFTNMSNVAGKKNFGHQFHQEVEYSEHNTPGTWHYLKVKEETNHERSSEEGHGSEGAEGNDVW